MARANCLSLQTESSSLSFAVAPVIANKSGARRAGQGRDSGERTLDAPKRSRTIEFGATAPRMKRSPTLGRRTSSVQITPAFVASPNHIGQRQVELLDFRTNQSDDSDKTEDEYTGNTMSLATQFRLEICAHSRAQTDTISARAPAQSGLDTSGVSDLAALPPRAADAVCRRGRSRPSLLRHLCWDAYQAAQTAARSDRSAVAKTAASKELQRLARIAPRRRRASRHRNPQSLRGPTAPWICVPLLGPL